MRNGWIVLLVFLLLTLSPLTASAQEGLEQLILQQHFTQKELERNLTLIKAEESRLQGEIARLDVELQRQKLVIEAMRRHAAEVARAYYTGERVSLLSLLFDAENFNELLLVFDYLQLLYQRDMSKLESFQAARAKAAALQSDKQARLGSLQALRQQYELRLAELLAIQAEKAKNMQKLSDPTSVQSLMTHLVEDWRDRGLPAFQTFFGVLSKVMFQIPELATPERIQSDGLLTHTLTIKQDEFNRFLMSKNELFKQSRFSFDNNQLIVEGTYDAMNLRLVGNYELVSPKQLKFRINELYFDGFALPRSTIEEMEKSFDLGFYPDLISPNIQVEGITMANQELKLQLKINLPFGFGKN
jgi:peptidoglycan hydrolase CwlO-like protein